jgi:hypothetical protein
VWLSCGGMGSEYNFARKKKSFMASIKQCKCATSATAAHIRFAVGRIVMEGSAAAGAHTAGSKQRLGMQQ